MDGGYADEVDASQDGFPQGAPLNRIRDVEERRFDGESLAEEVGDGPHAERLGGVVASREERHPELAGERAGVLLGLAREEGVQRRAPRPRGSCGRRRRC